MNKILNYRVVSLSIIIFLAFSLRTIAQESKNYPTIGEVVRFDNRINDLIGSDAGIELLASGFEWSEGPLWIQDGGGCLIFSDIPRNSVMKWKEGEGKLLGRIHTGKRTANCAWGNDGSVLYMTVDDSLCRIKTTTKGANWKNIR